MIVTKNLKLKANLVGTVVPDKTNGDAGRHIEDLLESFGVPIDRHAITDNPYFEVKSRDVNSTSPQTVGGMTLSKIKRTSWETSSIFEKIQIQYRVKTQNNVIIENTMYDFTGWGVQSLLKEAYENARNRIIAGDTSDCIYGNKFAYLERTNKKSRTWCLRIRDKAMKKLENISTSNILHRVLMLHGKLYE